MDRTFSFVQMLTQGGSLWG